MPPKKRPRLSRKTDLAARASTNRSGETHEDRETRLLANRERHLQTHAVETREQRQGRLAADASRNQQTRSAESAESWSRRNSANAARNRQTRSAESAESRSSECPQRDPSDCVGRSHHGPQECPLRAGQITEGH
ncbi:ATP-dependent DNA helicase [Caligus rogercresseyi]|uniref:ATP-dependent DNA helicase n=1 Tax=Caligus rogercresseyi TaxID=217165 RepID=A0A7T8GQN7_CALRO|nr:ATP-dependent DNA helicase [Caligus rogercresseyi]